MTQERELLREVVRYLVALLRRDSSQWDEITPYQGNSMLIHLKPHEPLPSFNCTPPWGSPLLAWLSRVEPSVASELETGRCEREWSLFGLAREPEITVDLPEAVVSIDAQVLGMQKQNFSPKKHAVFATVVLSFSSKKPLSGAIPDELWEGILGSMVE